MKYCTSLFVVMLLGASWSAGSYPLDGLDESGIRRLLGYQLAQDLPKGPKLSSGQLRKTAEISLRLTSYRGPDFDQLPEDAELAAFLAETLRERDPSYSMVLIDMTDPGKFRWAGLRPDNAQNPGSLGKLITMAALFHALKVAFPDVSDRARILREAVSTAGDWVGVEQHKVPKWRDAMQQNELDYINPADEFRLSEWLDHAISASANGAGAIVWREAMLIRQFGSTYPRSAEESARFFAETPKSVLGALALAVSNDPLREAEIDVAKVQQGSMWTANGKRKVPGVRSFGTAREIARILFRMEQGRLVDEWSSLQMKKYLYMTKRRYRYAYGPELRSAAVYFKSGSLYSCRPEEGFRCGKYKGNERNMMNSAAIVEGADGLHYIAALMTNVLKVNSAWDHSSIGGAVHETLRTRTRASLAGEAPGHLMEESGRSD